MPTQAQKVAVLFGRSYADKIRSMFGSSIVSYLPLSEGAGSVAADIGGRGLNGAYTAVTLGAAGIGDGRTAASFDGSTSFVNWYSAGLASAFSGAAGSLLGWFKVSAAGVWSDAVARRLASIQVDGNNMAQIRFNAAANTLAYLYNAGAGANNLSITSTALGGRLGWLFAGITWNKAADRFTAYELGAAVAAPTTGLGTWTGAPGATTTMLGALNTSASVPWSGLQAHWALLNREATAAEMAEAYRVP